MRINLNISRRSWDGLRQVNACYEYPDGTAIWGNYCKNTQEYYLAGRYKLSDGSLVAGILASGMYIPYEDDEIFQSTGTYNFDDVRKALLTGEL